MSEEVLCGEDKDKLRKRLELLQKEYERTALRLQRAERREAVRKHVQKTISDQLHTPAAPDQSSSSSSSSSQLLSNQPPETARVRFDLPDGSGSSPLPPLRCKRSPSLRLRSRRSRLRMQVKAKQADPGEREEGAGGRGGAGTENFPCVERAEEEEEEEEHQAETTAEQKGVETSPEVPSPEHPAQNEEQDASRNPDAPGPCTLIEGLPFPAEYYVRTTRRMSSARCPVGLDAVLLSQLATGRRRRRRSPKPRACGGGRATPVPKPGGRGQGRRRGRGRARDPDPGMSFGCLPVSRLYLDPPGTRAKGIERMHVPLDHVLTVLEVRDFHLPDDEFGRLKLERLRAAASNLEPLVYGSGHGAGRDGERFSPCGTTLRSQLTPADQSQVETGGTGGRGDGDASQSRLMLNLSVSPTSRTQVGPGAPLISVGESPGQCDRASNLSSGREPAGEHAKPCSENGVFELLPGRTTPGTRDRHRSRDGTEPELTDVPGVETRPGPEEHDPLGSETERILFSPEENLVDVLPTSPEGEPKSSVQHHGSGPGTRTFSMAPGEAPSPPAPGERGLETNSGNELHPPTQPEPEDHPDLDTPGPASTDDAAPEIHPRDPAQPAGSDGTSTVATGDRDTRTRPRGALRKTHSLKALDGGCVLDVCVVRWSPDDWCVCVAGEWSVCVWAWGAQRWDLRHTWTFTQSVISLQEVPDTLGLLCVCLGRLEIVEARTLCCPGVDGPFSQADLCRDDLQAVLAVSACRVSCCSSPKPQQIVQVFTLARDGRVMETRPLASPPHSVRTLAVVDGEGDALLGWTERKHVLVWNVKSGQLLQTVRLPEAVSTATCLRGYSYRGVLCVLLQQAGACDDDPGSALFTLMATNPLTGEHLTLTSISNPTAGAERLVDGDTCASALAGVFQSGHLAVWDLRGSVSCVYSDEHADACRLARWAGPDLLLTGYLNGDVNIYQYKPDSTSINQYKPDSTSINQYKPV